jgi:hypothetical protein
MQEVAFDLYKHYPPIDPPDFVHGEIRYGTEFRIRMHLILIRIQHFRLNSEYRSGYGSCPDLGF